MGVKMGVKKDNSFVGGNVGGAGHHFDQLHQIGLAPCVVVYSPLFQGVEHRDHVDAVVG